MTELMIEIVGYIAVAALLGFLLGWLAWGWGQRDRISAARAEGAREARTSVDGAAGLRDQLRASAAERARLEAEVDRLTERLAAADVAAGLRADDTADSAEDEADKAAASPGPDIPEASAAEVRPPAIPAGGEARDRPLPATAGRSRSGAPAAASGGPTGAPVPEEPPERPPAAVTDDSPRRTDELAARLASYDPPDVTLRNQIMSGSGSAGEAATEPDASPGGSEPDMSHPPASNLGRQRMTGSDEPPVADEQAPPGTEGKIADDGPDMPRPAAGTLRQQRSPEGAETPPVIDEQVPAPGGQADDPDLPRLAILRQQRNPDSDEPPVIDEQVPPEPDAGSAPVGAAGRPEAAPDGTVARPDDAAARPETAAPASLLVVRPDEIDDLRRIRGIGKVMERLLNRNGIWLYRQLAGLTPAETAWLARVLDMPLSRIERERWVEQAGSLHCEKYGSAPDEPGG